MDIEDAKLLELNRQGIIPGPDETDAEFLKRADFCLNIKERLAAELGGALPFAPEDLAGFGVMRSAFAEIRNSYDIAPEWIPIFFSNHQLSLWHGGCAWIFQLTPDTPTCALFQLRKAFRNNDRYLGIYSRDEVAVHELAHVGRMMFEEPKYEEIIAYKTARSSFRRFLGPLAQSSMEAGLFVLILILLVLLDIFLLAFGFDAGYRSAQWLKLVPAGIAVYGLLRLLRRQQLFHHCLEKLQILYGNHAMAVIYRLTDSEIELFSGSTDREIRDYALKQTTLRWRVINGAYGSTVSSNLAS